MAIVQRALVDRCCAEAEDADTNARWMADYRLGGRSAYECGKMV